MINQHSLTKPFWSRPAVLWLLVILVSIIWFAALDTRTLVPTDEGRYAEMAREMAATGDWVTTRLNGIKYFEKPPLQIWMTALTFKLFGLGEWQARLWTGFCGFAGILFTGIAAARVAGRDVGVMAASILASCAFWAVGGHVSSLDMSLAGAMTLALCGLLLAQTTPHLRSRAAWMLACWAGMGIAVMSKGLVGIALPGLVLIAYTLVARDWTIWKRLHLLSGLAVFCLITVPWFVLVSIRNPEFPHFFFIHEHFQRFTSDIHRREGPWHYFMPFLLIGLLPWVSVFMQSMLAATRPSEPSAGSSTFNVRKLLLVWSITIFVFFSSSGSKLPAYIMPVFPALAMLIALYLRQATLGAWRLLSGSSLFLSVAMLALVPQLTKFAGDPSQLANYQSSKPWLAAAGLTLMCGALPVLWWCMRKRTQIALPATLALASASLLAILLLMLGAESHGRVRSGLPLVPTIASHLTPTTPLYAVGLYDQTLPFYLRRTMTLVLHPDEMEFGLRQEPQLWLPTLHDFVQPWQSGPKAVAVMRVDIFEGLRDYGVPMREVARKGRQVVVINR